MGVVAKLLCLQREMAVNGERVWDTNERESETLRCRMSLKTVVKRNLPACRKALKIELGQTRQNRRLAQRSFRHFANPQPLGGERAPPATGSPG